MVGQGHVAADDHAARGDLDAAPDLVAQERAVRPHFEGTRHPAEHRQMAEWQARGWDQCAHVIRGIYSLPCSVSRRPPPGSSPGCDSRSTCWSTNLGYWWSRTRTRTW